MKQIRLLYWLTFSILLCSCSISREIVCDNTDEHGGRFRMTSANYLFSGCHLRLCEYSHQSKVQYGLELDIEDRIVTASKGDLLTIYLKNGETVVLKNLEYAKSEVTEHVEEVPQTQMLTDFIPVYSRMYDAVVAVPFTRMHTSYHKEIREDSFVKLHYLISQQQINQIIQQKVSHITISTDRQPIEAKAHRMSKILKEISTLFL